MFVVRDNRQHMNDIERHYRIAIRAARKRIVIANAYFFPGYRLIKELRRAARRGVDVRLILQGEPDMAFVKTAARMLYHQQASSEVRASDLVGQVARVVVAIPAGGVGQIRCRVGEELVDKIARTRDGGPVGENMSVKVEEVLGETVIVKMH